MNLWPERVFNLQPQGPYKEIFKLFNDQGWGKLLKPEIKINPELLREFYANALPENPHTDPFEFVTVARGRTIRFDREAINTYLGNPYPLADEDEFDLFHTNQNKGNFDHDEIKKAILLEGKNYEASDAGREHIAKYSAMVPEAKVILKLILHNIKPNSHLSDVSVDTTPLIYYILKGIKVDIARTIAWELKLVALQGKTGPKSRISFPGLVMGLIKGTRMKVPSVGIEELKNPVDDAFISCHIMKEKKGKGSKGASSSQAPPPQPEPQHEPQPEPFQMPYSDFAIYTQW